MSLTFRKLGNLPRDRMSPNQNSMEPNLELCSNRNNLKILSWDLEKDDESYIDLGNWVGCSEEIQI